MTPQQCRKARELLDMNLYDLGRQAGLQPADILLFENNQLARPDDVACKLMITLRDLGVMFVGDGICVPRPKAWRG